MKFDSYFKSYEDMVDAEVFTYLILGLNEEPIKYITSDASEEISQRLKLVLGAINSIEQAIEISIPKHFGQVYRVDSTTNKIVEVHNIQERMNVIYL